MFSNVGLSGDVKGDMRPHPLTGPSKTSVPSRSQHNTAHHARARPTTAQHGVAAVLQADHSTTIHRTSVWK